MKKLKQVFLPCMQSVVTKKTFMRLAFLIAVLHVLLVIGFGMQKHGFHEDEYYTYWSSTVKIS